VFSPHHHRARRRVARGLIGAVAPLIIATAVALPFDTARAQAVQAAAPSFDAKSAAHVRKEFLTDMDTPHSKILALANAIPADKYSWRPAPGVRSVSEVLMHVTGEWYHWAPSSMGGKGPAELGANQKDIMTKLQGLEKTTSKADVIAAMDKSWTYCRAQLLAADPAQMTGTYKPWGVTIDAAAFGMAGDLHEHLGQLIAYSRSVGVKPPWSK
jgi:uncharacterized damage-inducible protein DinB